MGAFNVPATAAAGVNADRALTMGWEPVGYTSGRQHRHSWRQSGRWQLCIGSAV